MVNFIIVWSRTYNKRILFQGLHKSIRNMTSEGSPRMLMSASSSRIRGAPYFYQTPRSQRIKDVQVSLRRLVLSDDSEYANEQLETLNDIVLKKSLSIYKTSPLYKFSFKKSILKILARKIGLHIQKVDMWTIEEDGNNGQKSVKVNVVPIRGIHDSLAGILVTVITTTEYDDENLNPVEKFWGLFCNPSAKFHGDAVPGNFVDLPLLLVKGIQSLTIQILQFFTKQFDCTIEKFYLAPIELTWLGAMWTGYEADIPGKPLKLKYSTPVEIKGIDNITMSIDAKNAAYLWKCIHDKRSDEFLAEEVNLFTRSLEAHFEKYFKLNLAALSLTEVCVTSLYAQKSGKIKLYSGKNSRTILTHILSIIELQMNY